MTRETEDRIRSFVARALPIPDGWAAELLADRDALAARLAELEAERDRVAAELRQLAKGSTGEWAVDPPEGFYERREGMCEAFNDAADLVERGGR